MVYDAHERQLLLLRHRWRYAAAAMLPYDITTLRHAADVADADCHYATICHAMIAMFARRARRDAWRYYGAMLLPILRYAVTRILPMPRRAVSMRYVLMLAHTYAQRRAARGDYAMRCSAHARGVRGACAALMMRGRRGIVKRQHVYVIITLFCRYAYGYALLLASRLPPYIIAACCH